MVVWSGRGSFALLFLLGIGIILQKTITNPLYENYRIATALFLTGGFCYYFGKKWNSNNSKTYINKETGEEHNVESSHSLFWIKLEYWGVIFPIVALIVLINEFV